jgi:hypothetical protein
MRRVGLVVAALAVCQLLWAGAVFAQAARETRLLVTVVDQSNAVLPTATVTVTGLEDVTRKNAVAPVQTTSAGVATIGALAPGRYSVHAEFPGFDPGDLKDVRLRPGDNKHIIVLAIQKMQETVSVSQNAQEGAADRRGGAFGTALTREQMDALSDDPDEMQRQLQDMAGPGAILRIDSFEGGRLPPKSMIKAIHITRDQFSAENHYAEGIFLDIITQPGVGPIRTGINYGMHNGAMTARNPFSATKGADQVQNYGVNFNGGLIKNKASFSFGMRGNSSFDNAILTAVLPGGATSDSLKLRSPRVNESVNGSFDYAITRDQTLRLSYNQNDGTNRNLGIGGFNLLERAYNSENHTHTFRIQEAGPIGRRFFINTRLNVGWTNTDQRSALEAPTVRVQEAFTSGGAQVAGGRHSRDMNLGSDLDYVRGRHSFRAGTQLDGNWYRSNETSNYLGTYVFENLDAFNAGLPRSYTRRVGDPNIRYFNLLAAFYVQDDVRLRRGLTLTPGMRYEAQTHVSDYNDLSPRIGLTWAPFKNGKTTLRGSWGLFYDWLPTGTYEQTLRVDGFRQQEVQIVNPQYPDLGTDGPLTAVNRYLLDPNLRDPRTNRVAGGVDYAFTPQTRISATFRVSDGKETLRGENLNAPDPVTHLRVDPTFGNVVEVKSDAQTRQRSMSVTGQFAPRSATPFGAQGPRWKWNRMSVYASYTLNHSENNTDGAFSTPATGQLSQEWGPQAGSAVHRASGSFSLSQLRNLNTSFNVNVSSGTPYSITTGRDDNGDLIFNDRPAGVGRNSARAPGQWSSSAYISYGFTFGPRLNNLPQGIMINGGPGGYTVTSVAPPSLGRYRIALTCQIQNLTNHTNLSGYSGNMLSPFFGKPTNSFGQRRVDVGMNLGF